MFQGVFSGSSSFPPLAKNQHSKFQLDLAKVDRKSHPTDCPLLIFSPCRLCHVWDQSLYILSREGMGGFLLYHPEINLVPPPPKLNSILMIPSIDRQCSVAPPPLCTLLAMTVSPPCYPENHVIPPSFFLPPPPVINNDRCFIFNFPLSRKKQFHIISRKNMSSTSRKWETLFVFSCFFFLFYCVVLMPFLSNFGIYL